MNQIQRELNVPHPPYCMEKNNMHMVGTTVDVLKGPHVEDNHEEGADLQVLVKIYEEESIVHALIDIGRKDEVFLAMENMAEDIPIESERKYDYLFMDWVDKYITKIEDQGCTRIAYINRGFLGMHTLKRKPHEFPLWLVDYSLEKVVDHIPYGSENKSP